MYSKPVSINLFSSSNGCLSYLSFVASGLNSCLKVGASLTSYQASKAARLSHREVINEWNICIDVEREGGA
jgi:hypothetical protein